MGFIENLTVLELAHCHEEALCSGACGGFPDSIRGKRPTWARGA